MELTNEFTVGVPVERAWEVLTDVELIAPCMPGAQLQEIEGDEYRGIVKIKVGPITAQYKGAARFVERDDAVHRAVLRAEGRDTRGQGNASATITMTPRRRRVVDGGPGGHRPDDHGPGRPVRPGRARRREQQAARPVRGLPGIQAAVRPGGGRAGRRAGADRAARGTGGARAGPRPAGHRVGGRGGHATLEDAAAAGAESARLDGTSGPAIRVVDGPEAQPVDLVEAAGAPIAKRVAPAVIGLTFLWLLSIFVRRRRRSRRNRRAG